MMLAAVLLSSLLAAAPLTVELGKEFRLEKGQTARIDRKTALRITGFVNSPCPKGAHCAWSGLVVNYDLTPKDAPYDVDVKDSDYRTFAVLVVEEPKSACLRLEHPGVQGECLRGLARRRSDPGLCREIVDARTRGFCLEDLAEALKKDELCRGVAAPTQYCLYLKAKAAKDRKLCEAIVLYDWRERCLKELSP